MELSLRRISSNKRNKEASTKLPCYCIRDSSYAFPTPISHARRTISKMPGFDFSNHDRNAALHANGVPLPKATSTGTTIVGCLYDEGVVVGPFLAPTTKTCPQRLQRAHFSLHPPLLQVVSPFHKLVPSKLNHLSPFQSITSHVLTLLFSPDRCRHPRHLRPHRRRQKL